MHGGTKKSPEKKHNCTNPHEFICMSFAELSKDSKCRVFDEESVINFLATHHPSNRCLRKLRYMALKTCNLTKTYVWYGILDLLTHVP
jgi:hypothetical protein